MPMTQDNLTEGAEEATLASKLKKNKNGKDDIADMVSKRLKLSKDFCKPYFDRFVDNYKHYFMKTIDDMVDENGEDAYPMYSRLTVPISYQVVETLLPRALARIPNFSIKTEAENDSNDEAALRDLIYYQMNHPYLIDDPIFLRFTNALKEMFITGNCWAQVPWMYKTAKVQKWQPHSTPLGIDSGWEGMEKIKKFGIEPEWKLKEEEEIMIDAPVFQHESIFHVFPDPKKKRVSDLGWVILEKYMTKEELKELIAEAPASYANHGALDDLKPYTGNSINEYDTAMSDMFGSESYATKDTSQGQYLVHEMREPNRYVIVVNEKVTLYDGPNPNGDGKIGLVLCKDIPVPGELFGLGEIDPIKRIEDTMSDQANMRNDAVFNDLLNMWKLDPEALAEGGEFRPEPGGVVEMNDLNGLQPIEKAGVSPSSYREYSEWNNIVQATTGVTDYATGNSGPDMNDTKGGVELLQQAANARFAFKIKIIEELLFRATGMMYVSRNLRFFDRPQSVNNIDGKKTVITPEQLRRLRGVVHFVVDAGSSESVSQATEVNKWSKVAELVGSDNPVFANISDESMDEIAKGMFYALHLPNPEKLLKRKMVQQAQIPKTGMNQQLPPEQTMALPGEQVNTNEAIS